VKRKKRKREKGEDPFCCEKKGRRGRLFKCERVLPGAQGVTRRKKREKSFLTLAKREGGKEET